MTTEQPLEFDEVLVSTVFRGLLVLVGGCWVVGELAGCTIGAGTALEMVADANVSADTRPVVGSASTVPSAVGGLARNASSPAPEHRQ